MEIDVEKYLTDAMKNQIIDDVRRDITAQVKQQFDYKQIAAEIKTLLLKKSQKKWPTALLKNTKPMKLLKNQWQR